MPRVARAEAIQTERRRRDDGNLDRARNMKLAIPPEFRDDTVHTYRWINDVNDRVHDLTVEDDWNICSRASPEATDADKYRRQVDTDKSGQPVYAFLVRKRKDWYEADKRKASERNNGREDALLQRPETDSPQAASTMYVGGGSSIRRGAYAP
jgi:hypothetical protein